MEKLKLMEAYDERNKKQKEFFFDDRKIPNCLILSRFAATF